MLRSLRCLGVRVCVVVCVYLCGVVKTSLFTVVGIRILIPERDMISEMRIFLLFGKTEAAAVKAVDQGAKSNMTSPHPAHGLVILKLFFDYSK